MEIVRSRINSKTRRWTEFFQNIIFFFQFVGLGITIFIRYQRGYQRISVINAVLCARQGVVGIPIGNILICTALLQFNPAVWLILP